jgi:hypothetical protein
MKTWLASFLIVGLNLALVARGFGEPLAPGFTVEIWGTVANPVKLS